MAGPRALDMALDLARMPAFAQPMSVAPLAADISEVIRIAAGSPDDCRAAALSTGMSEKALVEAARFYLQQVLFRPNADCYRILGIGPDASRESARDHMRWLLQWLHPDRNGGWEAIYAKQIVKAWREVSKGDVAAGNSPPTAERTKGLGRRSRRSSRRPASIRIPLIERPNESSALRKTQRWRIAGALKVAGGVLTILLLLGLIAPAWGIRSAFVEFSRRAGDCLSALICAW